MQNNGWKIYIQPELNKEKKLLIYLDFGEFTARPDGKRKKEGKGRKNQRQREREKRRANFGHSFVKEGGALKSPLENTGEFCLLVLHYVPSADFMGTRQKSDNKAGI